MIDVLLATYRPDERMLAAQQESIHAQRGEAVNVMVREDVAGEGTSANFSALLGASEAPYAAFADQDDVWEADKLQALMAEMRALEVGRGKDCPLLVFCDAALVDADVRPLGGGTFLERQGVDVRKGLGLSRLLMQNFISGNTMLFNAALRKKAGPIPPEALMHDCWMAVVAAAFGAIGFVDRPLVRYRQHGGNVVGATLSAAGKQRARAAEGAAAFRARLSRNIAQAQAFVARFGDESPEPARALAGFPSTGWLGRRRALFRYGLWKQGFFRNLALLAFA